MINTHQISFKSSSSYISYNKLSPKTESIWFVFHGYGQLSRYFIRRFDVLDKEKNYIIAPQGLSKFYLDKEYKNVGASWLTHEENEMDLLNQQNYLTELFNELKLEIDFSKIKVNFFGFSQGVSVFTRFLMKYDLKIDNLIFWSGWVPDEFFKINKSVIDKTNIYFVIGNEDQYYDNPILKEYIKKFKIMLDKKIDFNVFDGGHVVDRKILKKINEKL
jgi:predicted esterase|tara:strand:- start:355 stop:1008 length:654 start_codon:yes stop_codon:yes gene_type:complete